MIATRSLTEYNNYCFHGRLDAVLPQESAGCVRLGREQVDIRVDSRGGTVLPRQLKDDVAAMLSPCDF